MKYIIRDGILEKCIDSKNDKVIYIPDTVKVIGPCAFADVPPGQIRVIHFPDSIEEVHVRAFEGLGYLKKVYAYSCAEDETRTYDITDGEKVCGRELLLPLAAERLIILKGKRGNVFTLEKWFSFYPKEIYVPCDVRLKHLCTDSSVFGFGEGLPEKMTIYGPGEQLGKMDMNDRSGAAFHAPKLVLLNTWIETAEHGSQPSFAKLFQPESAKAGSFSRYVRESGLFSDDTEIRWQPFNPERGHFGLNDLRYAKEVSLPQGLEEMNNEINHCENLKKLMIPSSVYSMHNCVKDCPSLTNVWVDIHTDDRLRVDMDCFIDCPKLKNIILYEINPVTDVLKTVMKVPKTQWLKYHFIDHALSDLFEKHPCLAEKNEINIDPDQWTNFYGRLGVQRKLVLQLRSLSEQSEDLLSDEESNDLRHFIRITELIERISSFI